MTAFATVLAIFRAGATPVLADIDPRTALLDPSSVERCITARTKGVLVVHLYGQLRNLIPGSISATHIKSICWRTVPNHIWPNGRENGGAPLVDSGRIVFTLRKISGR